MEPTASLSQYLDQLKTVVDDIDPETVFEVAETLYRTYREGGTVFVCGNGGSASTASHMACDLSKNVTPAAQGRPRVVSLTDNMAHFSAIANDISYDDVFLEQLRNLMTGRDALVVISASGNSPNVVKAAEFALKLNAPVVAMTGFSGGKLASLSTFQLHVDCQDYGPVEDVHLVFNHLLVAALRSITARETTAPGI